MCINKKFFPFFQFKHTIHLLGTLEPYHTAANTRDGHRLTVHTCIHTQSRAKRQRAIEMDDADNEYRVSSST